MSFSIETFGLTGEKAVNLGNIFKVSDEYLSGVDVPHAHSMELYPYLEPLLIEAGISLSDATRERIPFPVIGFPGTFPGLGTPTFTSVEQHITAYPITLPTTLTLGHGSFCNYNCGFGFGLDSYLSGLESYEDGYYRVNHISEQAYDENGSLTLAGGSRVSPGVSFDDADHVYDTIPAIGMFVFGSKPFNISNQIKEWISTPYGGSSSRPKFVPFYYKFKITAYRGFSVASTDSEGTRATSVLAESTVRPWEFHNYIFQDTATTGILDGNTLAEETGKEATTRGSYHTNGFFGYQSSMSYPYVDNHSSVEVITDSIADREMALYTANVVNNVQSAYRENVAARYISRYNNLLIPQYWIQARVNYISATLTATEMVETPKAFRVKKQISPDMHKRNYSTFRDSGENTISTTTYSRGAAAGGGSTPGSSY